MNYLECLDKGHFFEPSTVQEKIDIFKSTVTNVVIEISSHCNRHCTYCPVSLVDRSSENKLLAEGSFRKIVDNLSLIDYSGGVCLNLYNEPMSDRPLLIKRIRAIRDAVPKCRIYFSTNGDYLDEDYINEMVDAGLSELYVTLHAPKGKPYVDSYVVSRFCELSVRLGKAIKINTVAPGQGIQGKLSIRGININVFSTNYDVYGSDRGGTISNLSAITSDRKAPCDRPFNDFTISYDGTIFPCCQMFVDDAVHKSKYSVGNISDFESIFDAYASNKMGGWRSSLLTFGKKQSPCDTCSENNRPATDEEKQVRNSIYVKFIGNVEGEKVVVKPKKFFKIFQGFDK